MAHNFVERMEEAKRVKRELRNRGISQGSFRGSIAARPVEQEPEDELEREFARIARAIADVKKWFANDLHWIVLEINDPSIKQDCPF